MSSTSSGGQPACTLAGLVCRSHWPRAPGPACVGQGWLLALILPPLPLLAEVGKSGGGAGRWGGGGRVGGSPGSRGRAGA